MYRIIIDLVCRIWKQKLSQFCPTLLFFILPIVLKRFELPRSQIFDEYEICSYWEPWHVIEYHYYISYSFTMHEVEYSFGAVWMKHNLFALIKNYLHKQDWQKIYIIPNYVSIQKKRSYLLRLLQNFKTRSRNFVLEAFAWATTFQNILPAEQIRFSICFNTKYVPAQGHVLKSTIPAFLLLKSSRTQSGLP